MALHIVGCLVDLLIAARNNFVIGTEEVAQNNMHVLECLRVLLQIKKTEYIPKLFKQSYSGSTGRLDASRRFFQLRKRKLTKSVFHCHFPSTLSLEGRESRITPSPCHMHTL